VNPILKNIIDILDVEELERNLYRGQNHKTEHVFGGQVLAQAIAAAYRTVEADHDLHSIHSYFIRPGDWNVPIIYEVDRIRDGINPLNICYVACWQLIFTCTIQHMPLIPLIRSQARLPVGCIVDQGFNPATTRSLNCKKSISIFHSQALIAIKNWLRVWIDPVEHREYQVIRATSAKGIALTRAILGTVIVKGQTVAGQAHNPEPLCRGDPLLQPG